MFICPTMAENKRERSWKKVAGLIFVGILCLVFIYVLQSQSNQTTRKPNSKIQTDARTPPRPRATHIPFKTMILAPDLPDTPPKTTSLPDPPSSDTSVDPVLNSRYEAKECTNAFLSGVDRVPVEEKASEWLDSLLQKTSQLYKGRFFSFVSERTKIKRLSSRFFK